MFIIFILFEVHGLFVVCSLWTNSSSGTYFYFLLLVLMVPFLITLFQTVATVCVFLASKVEDTPCPVDHVVRVAYETMYRRDTAAAQRIRQKVPLN